MDIMYMKWCFHQFHHVFLLTKRDSNICDHWVEVQRGTWFVRGLAITGGSETKSGDPHVTRWEERTKLLEINRAISKVNFHQKFVICLD